MERRSSRPPTPCTASIPRRSARPSRPRASNTKARARCSPTQPTITPRPCSTPLCAAIPTSSSISSVNLSKHQIQEDFMTRIAFIGLGNMGGGMAANQAKAGHEVLAFDLSKAALEKAVGAGCAAAGSAAQHVRSVYADEILPNAKAGALLIDCSTIDVESARAVAAQAKAAGFRFA